MTPLPNDNPKASITRLLIDWSGGNTAALDELLPIVHAEQHTGSRKVVNIGLPINLKPF